MKIFTFTQTSHNHIFTLNNHMNIFGMKTKQNENGSRIYLQPTDKKEIPNIISSLNCNKASSPSNIPYRVLFLLKIIPWNFQAIGIFIQPLFHGVFPSVLKTPKLAVFQQDSKLDYFNYFPISLLSNTEKTHQKFYVQKIAYLPQ